MQLEKKENKQKSVLIYYSKFNVGGAEKSNLRLIKLLVKHGWKVTLVLKYAGGTLEQELPDEVHIIHLAAESYINKLVQQKSFGKKLIQTIKIAVPYLSQQVQRGMVIKQLHNERYDIAVIGLQGLNPSFVIKNINAGIRLLWIRNDLLYCDPDGRIAGNITKYGHEIDCFPCVSKTSYDSFCKLFPELKDKAKLFYNVINAEDMIKCSNEKNDIEGKFLDACRVITVCRIRDKAKGVFRMLDVYKRLRNDGIFFYWIIVGEGSDLEELRQRTHKEKLDDGFILLGHKSNPFPYYKYCDISATLSYYEGLCGTVNEAKIMGLPVIATEFSGIHEQIIHGKNGWIVENNEDAIYVGMKKILQDKKLRKSITNDWLPEAIANDENKEELMRNFLKERTI